MRRCGLALFWPVYAELGSDRRYRTRHTWALERAALRATVTRAFAGTSMSMQQHRRGERVH